MEELEKRNTITVQINIIRTLVVIQRKSKIYYPGSLYTMYCVLLSFPLHYILNFHWLVNLRIFLGIFQNICSCNSWWNSVPWNKTWTSNSKWRITNGQNVFLYNYMYTHIYIYIYIYIYIWPSQMRITDALIQTTEWTHFLRNF